jgi:hypothetical protein
VMAAGGLAERGVAVRAQAPQIWPRWGSSLRRRLATSGSVLRPGDAAGGPMVLGEGQECTRRLGARSGPSSAMLLGNCGSGGVAVVEFTELGGRWH